MKLKSTWLALPVILSVTGALAETSTTSEAGQNAMQSDFGQNWTPGMSSAFFSDDDRQTLRGDSDLSSAWEGMAESDREMLRADCMRMSSMDGGSASTASSEDITAANSASAGTVGNDRTDTAEVDGSDIATVTDPTASGSTTTMASVSHDNLSRLCSALELSSN